MIVADDPVTATVPAPVASADKTFRVPDDPTELLDLQEELEKENANIDSRIARATEQRNNNVGRLARISEKLAGIGDIKAAVAKKVESMNESMARLKAKFNL